MGLGCCSLQPDIIHIIHYTFCGSSVVTVAVIYHGRQLANISVVIVVTVVVKKLVN